MTRIVILRPTQRARKRNLSREKFQANRRKLKRVQRRRKSLRRRNHQKDLMALRGRMEGRNRIKKIPKQNGRL